MSLLAGRHALVTGAGSGIGAAVSRALSAAGAAVSLAGRRAEPLQETAGALAGRSAVLAGFDVTAEAAIRQGVAHAEAALGPIDLLINNAGGSPAASFADTDPVLWQDVLSLNLTGAYLVTRAVLPGMLARDAGRVVMIASTAGLQGYRFMSAYCAAKHGLIGLTRALALEAARTGITVNAVCPSFTETPLLDRARVDRAALARRIPQNRLVTAEEVAATVLWLVSSAPASLTGQAIAVDGGELIS